jgi:hypothetical protein
MDATDCEILNADIPILDAVNCCDHEVITCIQDESGELRVARIFSIEGNIEGYAVSF